MKFEKIGTVEFCTDDSINLNKLQCYDIEALHHYLEQHRDKTVLCYNILDHKIATDAGCNKIVLCYCGMSTSSFVKLGIECGLKIKSSRFDIANFFGIDDETGGMGNDQLFANMIEELEKEEEIVTTSPLGPIFFPNKRVIYRCEPSDYCHDKSFSNFSLDTLMKEAINTIENRGYRSDVVHCLYENINDIDITSDLHFKLMEQSVIYRKFMGSRLTSSKAARSTS